MFKWNWGESILDGLQTDAVKATVNASHSKDNERIRVHFSFQTKPQGEKEQKSEHNKREFYECLQKEWGESDWQTDEFFEMINLEAQSGKGQTKPKSRAQLRVRKITANTIKVEGSLDRS